MGVRLREVVKSFGGAKALDTVSLTVEPGAFFTVLGPSGCGKTTLLRLIAGLEMLDSGEIRLHDRLVADRRTHIPPEQRNVAVVFQSYALWPHMTVKDNVAFPRLAARASIQEAEQSASSALDAVAMKDFAARKPAQLSGGQRQRVALARCLAQEADIVLMDEPLANLDPHLRGAMEEEFAAFRERTSATIIYITHDQREAMALSDQAAVMDRGRILQIGAPETLYRRPANEQVAAFIGRSALMKAEVIGVERGVAAVRIGPFQIGAEHGGEAVTGAATAMIRPEDVAVGQGETQATIERAFYRGGVWEISLRVEGVSDLLPAMVRHRPVLGESVPIQLLRAWLLQGESPQSPKASIPPGNNAVRQPATKQAERQH